ncbi:hypothetical protein EYF80_047918 [Liparis tanakae]|uniref:Uncharacterized protein n=1 Tax=Liparis tanakae TaxID=230148 RepID=A0A4Z2FNL5_9TELE|nr:hypothetical protein EYF80_047918 [Liparis tanakae]
MHIARYTMISCRRGEESERRPHPPQEEEEEEEEEAHLGEDGHADVVAAGLLDEGGQLVGGDRGGDGLLPRLGGQAHRQVLLVRQQISAGLRSSGQSGERGEERGRSLTCSLSSASSALTVPPGPGSPVSHSIPLWREPHITPNTSPPGVQENTPGPVASAPGR